MCWLWRKIESEAWKPADYWNFWFWESVWRLPRHRAVLFVRSRSSTIHAVRYRTWFSSWSKLWLSHYNAWNIHRWISFVWKVSRKVYWWCWKLARLFEEWKLVQYRIPISWAVLWVRWNGSVVRFSNRCNVRLKYDRDWFWWLRLMTHNIMTYKLWGIRLAFACNNPLKDLMENLPVRQKLSNEFLNKLIDKDNKCWSKKLRCLFIQYFSTLDAENQDKLSEDFDYQYDQESVTYGPPTYEDFMATSTSFLAATTGSWETSYTDITDLGLVTNSAKFVCFTNIPM